MCRKERALAGHGCEHSVEVCLGLANSEGAFDKYARGRIISRKEALEIIKRADEEGLIHATYNVQKRVMAVCNCCPCSCLMLGGMMKHNAPHLITKSNYAAAIDEQSCSLCGLCAESRCPVGAITYEDGAYRVEPEKCLGCGVCRPTCPTGSITLFRKAEAEHVQPPKNLVDWYTARAQTRGGTVT